MENRFITTFYLKEKNIKKLNDLSAKTERNKSYIINKLIEKAKAEDI